MLTDSRYSILAAPSLDEIVHEPLFTTKIEGDEVRLKVRRAFNWEGEPATVAACNQKAQSREVALLNIILAISSPPPSQTENAITHSYTTGRPKGSRCCELLFSLCSANAMYSYTLAPCPKLVHVRTCTLPHPISRHAIHLTGTVKRRNPLDAFWSIQLGTGLRVIDDTH